MSINAKIASLVTAKWHFRVKPSQMYGSETDGCFRTFALLAFSRASLFVVSSPKTQNR